MAKEKTKRSGEKPLTPTVEMLNIPIAEIEFSDMNANAHDGAVSDALRESMRKQGFTHPPLLMRKKEGGYRCLSGEHRVVAWADLGNATVPAVVQGFRMMTKEEEFSLVQNYNAIRGKMDLARARRIIKEHDLDLTRIDILGLNPASLFPSVGGAAATEESARNREARLRLLAAEISEQIAALIVDEKEDSGVLVIEAKDRVAVLISIGPELGWARRARTYLRKTAEQILAAANTKYQEDSDKSNKKDEEK